MLKTSRLTQPWSTFFFSVRINFSWCRPCILLFFRQLAVLNSLCTLFFLYCLALNKGLKVPVGDFARVITQVEGPERLYRCWSLNKSISRYYLSILSGDRFTCMTEFSRIILLRPAVSPIYLWLQPRASKSTVLHFVSDIVLSWKNETSEILDDKASRVVVLGNRTETLAMRTTRRLESSQKIGRRIQAIQGSSHHSSAFADRQNLPALKKSLNNLVSHAR